MQNFRALGAPPPDPPNSPPIANFWLRAWLYVLLLAVSCYCLSLKIQLEKMNGKFLQKIRQP